MAVFQLLINGVDYTDILVLDSLNITEDAQVRGFSMSARLQINQQAFAAPQTGQYIKFMCDGRVEFSGRIANAVQVQNKLPGNYAYDLTCVDHSTDLDNELLSTVFSSGQTVGDIIRQIIGRVGRGFTSNNVANGITVGELKIDLEAPSAVIQKLADSVEYQWYIDYNRDVHFFFLLDRPAPVATIDVDVDTVNTNKQAIYHSLKVDEQWDQVKNVIWITGAKAKSGNQDSLTVLGDGTQKFFPLNYEPWDINSMTVSVNSVPQTLKYDGIDGQAGDGQGGANDIYVCFDNWGIRRGDGQPPANGQPVVVNYNYAYEAVVKVEDPVSIAAMKARENYADAPSNGRHEVRFEVPELRVDSESSLIDYGNLLLLRYAQIVTVATFESDLPAWSIGQNFRLVSGPTKRNIDMTMFVRKITKVIRRVDEDEAEMSFSIEAASSAFPG